MLRESNEKLAYEFSNIWLIPNSQNNESECESFQNQINIIAQACMGFWSYQAINTLIIL